MTTMVSAMAVEDVMEKLDRPKIEFFLKELTELSHKYDMYLEPDMEGGYSMGDYGVLRLEFKSCYGEKGVYGFDLHNNTISYRPWSDDPEDSYWGKQTCWNDVIAPDGT